MLCTTLDAQYAWPPTMCIPKLSRIFVIAHTVIALIAFPSMWANKGGYQNGLQQWGVLGVLDFPVFFLLHYVAEGQSVFNPALIPEMTLNWIYLGYALLVGSLYWFALGWAITCLYRKVKRHHSPQNTA